MNIQYYKKCFNKLLILLIVMYLNIPLFSFDISEIKLKNQDFIFIDSDISASDKNEAAKEALREKKFLLQYDKQSFEKVFMEGNENYSPVFDKVGNEWKTEIVKDGHEVKYNGLSEYHEFFDKGKYYYLVQFVSWQPELKACPVGRYIVEVYFNNEVYAFSFEAPGNVVKDENFENLFTQMNEYVQLRKIYEENLELGCYTQVEIYCWKTSASRYQFFKDMRYKKPNVPEYVLGFQKRYEKCLNQILECFDGLSL